MTEDDDYDALSQKQLASIKRDMRISLEDAAVRATHKVVTELTEKNLEAVLLNLTKTDRPITVKPTTCFGNPAKTAQWYTCPNCEKQSPLTLEWVGLTKEEIAEFDTWHDNREEEVGWCNPSEIVAYIEAKLKQKNGIKE